MTRRSVQRDRLRRGHGELSVSNRGRRLRFESCELRAMLSAVTVTTSADDGPGSFRDAIEQANNDSDITSIVFRPQIQTVKLLSTVTYEGEQDLSIDGNTVNIQPAPALQGEFDLFVSDGGADLSLREITFRNGSNGVVVDVPLTATGEVEVSLDDVTIADN